MAMLTQCLSKATAVIYTYIFGWFSNQTIESRWNWTVKKNTPNVNMHFMFAETV